MPDENGSDYINASYIEVGTMMYSMMFTYTLNRNCGDIKYHVNCRGMKDLVIILRHKVRTLMHTHEHMIS